MTVIYLMNKEVLLLSFQVDCKLGSWSDEPCTATCGTSSTKRLTRKVIQEALYGGKPCLDTTEKTEECNVPPCPGEFYT